MVWIAIFLVFLLAVRLMLPYALRSWINKKLAANNQYNGTVRQVAVNLIGGKIIAYSIQVNKRSAVETDEAPYITIAAVHIQFQWAQLLRKSFVGTITVIQPQITMIREHPDSAEPTHDQALEDLSPATSGLKKMLTQMLPFHVEVNIDDCKLRYIDYQATPPVDVLLESLNASFQKLSNMGQHEDTPAAVVASARIYEGLLNFNMTLYPMADHLTFDLNLALKDTNMVLLNDFFRAYARIDVNQGTFSMYTEIAARGGSFEGYVKPVLKDLDIVGAEDKNDSLFRKLWERFAAVVIQVLENNKDNQITTKIPIAGKLNDAHINIFAAIAGILQNAFIRAIQPSFDNVVNISSVFQTAKKGTKRLIKKLYTKGNGQV